MRRRELHDPIVIIMATVVTAAIVAALVWARSIFIPLALSIFLAFVLAPMVNRLRNWRLGRVPAVLLTVSFAIVLAGSIGWMISRQVAGLIQELPDHADTIRSKLEAGRLWIQPSPGGRFDYFVKEIEHGLGGRDAQPVDEPLKVVIENNKPAFLAHMESAIGPAAEFAAQGALSFLLVVFLLLGREDMRNRLIRLIGPNHVTMTTRAVDDAVARISRFLRVQLFVNAAFGACLALGLSVVGVPYAVLWGFFAGILRYIPYIGTWIGFAPPLIAAIAMSPGWQQPIGVIATYVALEILFAGAIEPRFFGKSLGLSEVAQVLSAAFWGFLWGPIGLILSGPITACLLVLGKNVPQLQWLDIVLGDEEPLSADMRLFQRLAARDSDEALMISEEYLEHRGHANLATDLMVPVLARMQLGLSRGELSNTDVQAMTQIIRHIGDEIPEDQTDEGAIDEPPTRVLGIAAHGPVDQMALELLAKKMHERRWDITLMPENSLVSEVVGELRRKNFPIVVIVSLSPLGFSHARYLSKKVRTANNAARIMVGRWGDAGTYGNEKEELLRLGVNDVTESLDGTGKLLEAWRGTIDSAFADKTEPSLREKTQLLGTSSAL